MIPWRALPPAGLAGGLAFAVCFAAQALLLEALLRLGVAQPLAFIAVLVAPAMEEAAKWWARARFRASWALAGAGFGVMEALLKPLTLQGWTLAAGMLVAPLQHAAYGGWARRRGLGFAIGLHTAFNALVLGASAWLGPAMWLPVLPAAALMLALSRRRPLDARPPPP